MVSAPNTVITVPDAVDAGCGMLSIYYKSDKYMGVIVHAHLSLDD